MKVCFRTSIADGPLSFIEGAILDLPTPLPRRFLDWLQRGIVAPVRDVPELAIAPMEVEQAVARRQPRRRRMSSRVTASRADGP